MPNPPYPPNPPVNAPPLPPRPYPPPPPPGYQQPYMPPAAVAAGVDAAGTVIADSPCRKCGYNLRGLNMSGRCPECGTAIGLSVYGDLLRFADPDWVEILRKGINLILAGICVIIIGAVLGAVLGRGSAAPGGGPFPALLGLVAAACFIGGAWLLTTPDPSGLGEDQYGTARKIIRFALLVGIVNNLLQFAQGTMVHDVNTILTLAAIGTLAGLVGLVGQVAQLQYLSKLALRIPDQPLSARAHFLMWAIGISFGLATILSVVMLYSMKSLIRARLTGGGGGAPAAAAAAGVGAVAGLGCFAAIAGLAVIVFGIMYLLMLDKFGRRFKEQAEYARQTWAAGGSPAQRLPGQG